MLKWFSRVVFALVLIFFLLVGIFFAVRNPQPVSLDLVFWQAPEFSVSLYLLLAFALGAIVAIVASSIVLLKAENNVRVLSRRCTNAQKELDSLRKASLAKDLDINRE